MIILYQFREEGLFVTKIGNLCFLVYPSDVGSVISVKVVAFCNVPIVLSVNTNGFPTGTEEG